MARKRSSNSKRSRSRKKKGGGKKKYTTNFRKTVRRDAERQEKAKSSYGYLKLPRGIDIFNPEPGSRVYMDIMPYIVTDPAHPDRYEEENIAVEDSLWYKRPFKIHRNIGVEDTAVVCLTSVGKPCPICEYRKRRMKEGADADELKEIKTSQRNLYVVIPRKNKDYEEKPHIWEMSQYLFQNLLNQELEEDEDYAVFPDLEEGKTLKVRFDESNIGKTKFAEASRIDFYDRKQPYDESILDDIPNLDECLEILTYEELEAKFMEIDPADMEYDEGVEEEWEEEEEPPTTRRRKTAEPKEEEWEEEEEFEEEEWEDEEEEWEDEEPWEEEEEWEDEEEWEEEFEEEPEPEPEPKKRSRKRGKKRSRKRKK